jgi:hypothetical protein
VPQVGKSVGRLAQGSAGNQSAQVGLPTKSYCACLTPAAPAGRERRHQEPNPRRTSVSGTPRYGGKSRRELEIAVQVPAVRIIRIGLPLRFQERTTLGRYFGGCNIKAG